MPAFVFYCSSRKNRELPFSGAFGVTGAGCTEKGLGCLIFMQHNMGLCCMNGLGGGGRVAYPIYFWGGTGLVTRKF